MQGGWHCPRMHLCLLAVRRRAADQLLPAGPLWLAREKGPCHHSRGEGRGHGDRHAEGPPPPVAHRSHNVLIYLAYAQTYTLAYSTTAAVNSYGDISNPLLELGKRPQFSAQRGVGDAGGQKL